MDTVGLGEIIGLAVIGLLIYGPEELPKFIRKVTDFIANVKAYAQRSLDEVKDLSGLEDESFEDIKQLGSTITDLRKPLHKQLGGLAALSPVEGSIESGSQESFLTAPRVSRPMDPAFKTTRIPPFNPDTP